MQDERSTLPKERVLCVIIADHSRFVLMQEPVRHRSVAIRLTASQMETLRLRYTGTNGGTPMYEEISSVFLEEE